MGVHVSMAASSNPRHCGAALPLVCLRMLLSTPVDWRTSVVAEVRGLVAHVTSAC